MITLSGDNTNGADDIPPAERSSNSLIEDGSPCKVW